MVILFYFVGKKLHIKLNSGKEPAHCKLDNHIWLLSMDAVEQYKLYEVHVPRWIYCQI